MDADSLQTYRNQFGADYYERIVGNLTFLVVNSETARSPQPLSDEYDAQWRWLEETLNQHALAKSHQIILVMHRPPFESEEDEAESARNWPPDSRVRLLSLARKAHVRLILAGHLHETRELKTHDGIAIETVAGSSRIFDDSPVGFKLFKLASGSVQGAFVDVAPPPRPPLSIPGLREWTPRLFEFSWRHWFFTAAFAWVAIRVHRGYRRQPLTGRGKNLAPTEQKAWRLIFWGLVFLGVNYQLDFDELLREVGRIGAKLSGIHTFRHLVTGTGLLLGTGWLTLFSVRRFRSKAADLSTTVALVALGVPFLWFVLGAISHHDLGMLVEESTWDVLTMISLGLIAWAAGGATSNLRAPAPPRRAE
jgi:hypothetical protein